MALTLAKTADGPGLRILPKRTAVRLRYKVIVAWAKGWSEQEIARRYCIYLPSVRELLK